MPVIFGRVGADCAKAPATVTTTIHKANRFIFIPPFPQDFGRPDCTAFPGSHCPILAHLDAGAHLCETVVMPKRAIRIVKHIGSTPVIAACVACGQQFQAPTASLNSVKNSTDAIQKQFDVHKCEPPK